MTPAPWRERVYLYWVCSIPVFIKSLCWARTDQLIFWPSFLHSHINWNFPWRIYRAQLKWNILANTFAELILENRWGLTWFPLENKCTCIHCKTDTVHCSEYILGAGKKIRREEDQELKSEKLSVVFSRKIIMQNIILLVFFPHKPSTSQPPGGKVSL